MPRLMPYGLAVVLTIGLAACGSTDDHTHGTSPSGTQGSAMAVRVQNCGHNVTVPHPPQRIAALNQSSTETLLSLGVGSRIVGTSTWFDPVLPALAADNAKIKRLADDNPSLESVLAVKPDMVAATYFADLPGEGATKPADLEKLGVPVYMAPAECAKSDTGRGDGERTRRLTLDQIYQEVTDLATLTGEPENGRRLVASLRDRVARVGQDRPSRPIRVAFWFASSESPYVAGGLGSPQIAADALGLTNVYASSKQEWPQVGWEDFAAKDPDVIVLADLSRRRKSADSGDEKVAFLTSNPVTAQMRAVKGRKFVRLPGSDLNPSIRTVDSMEKIKSALVALGMDTAR